MHTAVGRVAEVWRVPVKSMLGERVPSGRLTAFGLEGDRRWALVDEEGHALSAKWDKRLLEASARSGDEAPVITLPDGSEVACGDPSADAVLSGWLGKPVRLEQADRSSPRTFRMHEDPLDDTSTEVAYRCPLGTFLDVAAVHLLTTASLAAAARLHPDGDWDVRRFRPTALLDVDGDGFVEDGWVDRVVRLGGAAVQVFLVTVRCAMPARAQGELRADPGVLRTLNRHHGFRIGVYAGVVEDGVVAEGDEVVVEPPA